MGTEVGALKINTVFLEESPFALLPSSCLGIWMEGMDGAAAINAVMGRKVTQQHTKQAQDSSELLYRLGCLTLDLLDDINLFL